MTNISYYYNDLKINDNFLKKQYLEELQTRRKWLEKNFFNYASQLENIIVRSSIAMCVKVSFDATLSCTYDKNEILSYDRGYNVEIKGSNAYVSKDTEYKTKKFVYSKNAYVNLTKTFLYLDKGLNEPPQYESEFARLSINRDSRLNVSPKQLQYIDYGNDVYTTDLPYGYCDPRKERIKVFLEGQKLNSYTDAEIIKKLLNMTIYKNSNSIISELKNNLHKIENYKYGDYCDQILEYLSGEIGNISLKSVDEIRSVNEVEIYFAKIYDVGVVYENKSYLGRVDFANLRLREKCNSSSNNLSSIFYDLDFKFSEKAKQLADKNSKDVRNKLIRNIIADTFIYILITLVTIIMFRSMNGLKIFLAVLLLLPNLIIYILTAINYSYEISEASHISNKQIEYFVQNKQNDLYKKAMSNVGGIRIALYIIDIITIVYLILQAVLF